MHTPPSAHHWFKSNAPITWHWTSLRGGEAERMKLFECGTRPQVVVVVSLSFISELCRTHTARPILHTWQAWCCLNSLDDLLLGMHGQGKGGNISSFHLSSACIQRGGDAILPSMLSVVWGGWAGQKPWIAHHLSCVIIRLIEAHCPNTSWRTHYRCNSLLRDTSLAWCT